MRNSRKTERGAGKFVADLVVRAAPFALAVDSAYIFATRVSNVWYQ
jgi:hypothetical protein